MLKVANLNTNIVYNSFSQDGRLRKSFLKEWPLSLITPYQQQGVKIKIVCVHIKIFLKKNRQIEETRQHEQLEDNLVTQYSITSVKY